METKEFLGILQFILGNLLFKPEKETKFSMFSSFEKGF